jgi:hypothetical protein
MHALHGARKFDPCAADSGATQQSGGIILAKSAATTIAIDLIFGTMSRKYKRNSQIAQMRCGGACASLRKSFSLG